MDPNNIYASFGIIDVIVVCMGVYGFYSWYLLMQKQEIKKTLLVGGALTPEQCVDVEGFGKFMGTKLLVLSTTLVVFGGISLYDSNVSDLGAVLWVAMAVFFAVIIWYCVHLTKAQKLYFNVKSGKSIKDKAMNK